MISDSPHLYRHGGRAAGRPDALLDHALAQASRVESRGLRAVLTLKHLSHQTGASYPYLREIVQRIRDPYTEFSRTKRSGQSRTISTPELPLMSVQRWILRNILSRIEPHAASFAYQRSRSAPMCAVQHIGAKWLLKTDLHDFFPTIDERAVYRVFLGLGYVPLVSLELSRICTRSMPNGPVIHPDKGFKRYTAIPSYSGTSRMGVLPQGAPTSGALANLAAVRLDERVARIARTRSLIYTRYVDDIVLSGSGRFIRGQVVDTLREVESAAHASGFLLHRRKTQIVPSGARKIVLGVLIGDTGIRIRPEMRSHIQAHIRGVDRFGLDVHARHWGFASVAGIVNHVWGLLWFANDVEPEWSHERQRAWSEILIRQGWTLPYDLM